MNPPLIWESDCLTESADNGEQTECSHFILFIEFIILHKVITELSALLSLEMVEAYEYIV